MRKSGLPLVFLIFLILFVGYASQNPSNKETKRSENIDSSITSNQEIIFDKRISKDQPITGAIVIIDGGREPYPVLRLGTKENIMRILNVHTKLENYKDIDILSRGLDVQLKYILGDGKKVSKKFIAIRLVDDYFKDIFNTMEAKKQMISIFKVKPNQIAQVKFFSHSNQLQWETTDQKIIKESFDNILRHYEETNYYGDQRTWVTIADVDFLNKSGKFVGRGIILRGESQWDRLFTDNSNIKKLKISPGDVKEIILTETASRRSLTVTDKNIIKNILDTYLDGSSSRTEVSVDIILKKKNIHGGHVYGSYDRGYLADFITQMFIKH